LNSPDESQSFVAHPPVLADLTLREICRLGDRRRENHRVLWENAIFV